MNLFLLFVLLAAGFLRTGPEATSVSVAVAPSPVAVSSDDYAHPDWLVDGDWLRTMLAADANVKVIALTDEETFAKGHIPGAAQVDWKAFEIVETGDEQVATWRTSVEETLTQLGVEPGNDVVVYDGGTFYAARVWWILDQLGHESKRILNGGWDSWVAAGGETETGTSTVTSAAAPYVGAPNDDAIATIAEVQAATDDPNAILIDARKPDEYAAGHVPGAINIPFLANAAADGPKTWLPATELRAMYEEAGVTPDRRVIPYCTTGVRSAATYFTLRLLGYENVSLFTGSFSEWSSDPARPVTTGEQP